MYQCYPRLWNAALTSLCPRTRFELVLPLPYLQCAETLNLKRDSLPIGSLTSQLTRTASHVCAANSVMCRIDQGHFNDQSSPGVIYLLAIT